MALLSVIFSDMPGLRSGIHSLPARPPVLQCQLSILTYSYTACLERVKLNRDETRLSSCSLTEQSQVVTAIDPLSLS